MENNNFAFSKTNFVLIGISALVVVIGFLMMIGAGSTPTQFDPDIFSGLRTKVAPVVCFIGFVSMIYAIVHKPTDRKEDER